MTEQEHAQAIGEGLPVPTRSGGAFKTAERRASENRASASAEDGLFEIEAPPPVSLRDRFGVPPFSILDRRAGDWQDRRRRWLAFGIESEIGRANNLLSGKGAAYGAKKMIRREDGSIFYAGETIEGEPVEAEPGCLCTHEADLHLLAGSDEEEGWAEARGGCSSCSCETYRPTEKANHYAYGAKAISTPDGLVYEVSQGATSVFDPVLCELAYRWYTAPGYTVLDPFAGGSVRGIVAGLLDRRYLGIDLRAEQVEANREQGHKIMPEGSPWMPKWATGDSCEVLDKLPPNSVDFVWSCPPYADLEVYSDDPKDLSTMEYEDFLAAHATIIRRACRALKPDRFAAWVISDVRDKKGLYRGLGAATVQAFAEAGLAHYNEGIILDPVGSAAVRAGRIFNGGRKLTRMHQYLHIFIKGDPKRATLALGDSEQQRGAE